ncbi:MAG: PaaI family thioesterase [Pseudomonadota bacterium]
MTLKERIAHARQVVGRDPLASLLGIRVDDVAKARAVVSLEPGPQHLNARGRVHGTTLYALVEQAVAVAANTLEGEVVVFETKANFLAGAVAGARLTASAQPVDIRRKLSLWEVRVKAPDGTLVALAQAMVYHLGPGDAPKAQPKAK